MKNKTTKKTIILFFPMVEKNEQENNIPYALLYLERALRDLPIELILIDERLNNNYQEIIKAKKETLILSGVSCMIGYQIIGALKFTETVKKYTQSYVIWGGWFPTTFDKLLLNHKNIDFIAIGQGELSLRELILSILNNNPLKPIKGILSNKNNTLINDKQELKSFNDLPDIDFSLIDINKLIDINGKVDIKYRGADYLATIGCPMNCSFCNLAYIFQKHWYPKPVNTIIRDIKTLVNIGNVKHITFNDDNFFVKRNFVISFCKSLMKNKINITWEANTHTKIFLNSFNDKDIELIKSAGCSKIKVGAESGDNEALKLLNKKCTREDNIAIVKKLSKYNIAVRLFTMVALPYNPDKDFNKTLTMITRAKLLHPDLDFNINIYKPIPKTKIYALALDKGFQEPNNISELIDLMNNGFFKLPWHKRNYSMLITIFEKVYIPHLKLHKHSTNNPLYLVINIILHISTRIRLKINYWFFPLFALIFIKINTNKNYKRNELEKLTNYKYRDN